MSTTTTTTTTIGSISNTEPWLPFEQPKDCSQGFCSIHCPQWCYIIFPPPPPFFSDDDAESSSSSSSAPTFSPIVIIIIGVLASAFLLVSYYTIISKYCISYNTLRRRFHRRMHRGASDNGVDIEEDHGASSRRHETWYNSPANAGLDETLIDKITVCKYKRDDGLIDSTECSVCLSEFREDESLRLLPKCSHAFHLHCIDTWLKSHSNCPLCRACILSFNPLNHDQLPPAPPEPPEETITVQLAVPAIEESNQREEQEQEQEEDINDHRIDVVKDHRDETIQMIRRSLSMDSLSMHRGGRVSIADVLRLSVDDDDDEYQVFIVARENKASSSSSSSRDNESMRRSGSGLHCVMSHVPMKRSFSSGRLCFTKHAILVNHSRGKSSHLLPL